MNNSASPLIILAGGFGSRLRSLVSDVPKPLAPIEGKPFLYYLIREVATQGAQKVVLSLHHEAHQFEEFVSTYKDLENWPEITLVTEPKPLGTGGAVKYCVEKLDLTGCVIVMNGDTFIMDSYRALESFNLNSRAVDGILGLVKCKNSERYGSVEVRHERVVGFHEKAKNLTQDAEMPGYIYSGSSKLKCSSISKWPDESFSIEREFFPTLSQAGKLGFADLGSDFIDIGIPEDYKAFPQWFSLHSKN